MNQKAALVLQTEGRKQQESNWPNGQENIVRMVSQKVRIKNPTGLHLRPAGILCKEALRYRCSVKFEFGEITANAKSVLSVLGACVKNGDEITFICDGPDEEKALAEMVALVESGLGES